MKKRTGKMISLSLAVAMAMTAAPVTALADENTQSSVIEASELTPAQSAGETGTDTTTVDTKEEEGTAWATLTPAEKVEEEAVNALPAEEIKENEVTTIIVKEGDSLADAFTEANAVEGNETVTIEISKGTFAPTANEQLKITRDNVVISGAGEDVTTIDCGKFSCSGQGGIIISANNVVIQNLTVTSAADSGNVATIKVTDVQASSEDDMKLLENVEIKDITVSSENGHGLNLHGVKDAVVNGLTVKEAGKCGISLANAVDVTVENTTVKNSGWGNIGMMYKNTPAYKNPVSLKYGTGNSIDSIYSERTSDGIDSIHFESDYQGTLAAPVMKITADEGVDVPTISTGVAKINDVYYATFDAALAAAENGDTITLVQDVELDDSISIPEGVTLDGDNQYTLSLTTSQNIFIDITKDNVTIQNITIDAQGNAKHAVQFWKSNSSKVLNCKIINDGKSAGKTYCTGIHVNSSNVTIENCEFNVTAKPALFGGGSAGVELGVSSDTSTESELPHINVKNLTGVPADNLVKVPMDTHFSIAQILGKTPFTEEYFDYLNENLLDGVVIDSDGTHCLFNIKFDANGGTLSGEGTMTTDANGKLTSALPTASLSGYHFDGWYTATSGGKKITADTVFTEDTTVYAQWSKKSSGGGSSHRYDGYITVIDSKNGDVSVSDTWADEDDKITLTITPDKGYVVDKIEIIDTEGDKIDAKKVEDKDDKYTFRMANCDVTVTVTFKEEGKTTEDTDKEEDKDDETTENTDLNFTDVKESDWFFKGVEYVVDKGIMSGVSENQFDPSGKLTRAMLVQMLYNMESRPACDAQNAFIDVPVGQWYTDAVIWANDAKIVSGMGEGLFAPNMEITREQMVAMLYNYAKYKGYDVTASADLSTFADNASVSAWAQPAMQWAVAEGYISGMGDNQLAPQGTATRAEIASVIMRFMEATAETAE